MQSAVLTTESELFFENLIDPALTIDSGLTSKKCRYDEHAKMDGRPLGNRVQMAFVFHREVLRRKGRCELGPYPCLQRRPRARLGPAEFPWIRTWIRPWIRPWIRSLIHRVHRALSILARQAQDLLFFRGVCLAFAAEANNGPSGPSAAADFFLFT